MSDKPDYFTAVVAALAAIAPVGSTVHVQTVQPGEVRLWVKAGDGDGERLHAGENHITHRAGHLLGAETDSAQDTVADPSGDIVARLALRLHGSADALRRADV
jgi:hypothetical protein